MAHQGLRRVLEDIGLSDFEASVYLASLSLGPSTVKKIAENADIKRTSVYYIIESLQKKGLMSIHIQGLRQLYAPEHPEKVESMVELRRQRFRKALPELMALFQLKGGESSVKYYEGLAGVKVAYESLLSDIRPHENWLVISDPDRWSQQDPEYFLRFRERRAKTGAYARLLLQGNEVGRTQQRFSANYKEVVKLLPRNVDLTSNIVATPHRMLMNQFLPPFTAIVIENPHVIQWHQQIFEILWNTLPEAFPERHAKKSS